MGQDAVNVLKVPALPAHLPARPSARLAAVRPQGCSLVSIKYTHSLSRWTRSFSYALFQSSSLGCHRSDMSSLACIRKKERVSSRALASFLCSKTVLHNTLSMSHAVHVSHSICIPPTWRPLPPPSSSLLPWLRSQGTSSTEPAVGQLLYPDPTAGAAAVNQSKPPTCKQVAPMLTSLQRDGCSIGRKESCLCLAPPPPTSWTSFCTATGTAPVGEMCCTYAAIAARTASGVCPEHNSLNSACAASVEGKADAGWHGGALTRAPAAQQLALLHNAHPCSSSLPSNG